MSLDTRILDGTGHGTYARVDISQRLEVAPNQPDLPKVGSVSRYRFYSSLLGSTGADSGTTNMSVNGSSTAQEFYIEAHADYDLHITCTVIIISDSTVVHNKFGSINALSTGWDLKITEAGDDTFIIKKATTGGEVIAQAGFPSPLGDLDKSWQFDKWTAADDTATVVAFPIADAVPGGLRIGRGTKDRIASVVNDNLIGLADFSVRAIGHRRYPSLGSPE